MEVPLVYGKYVHTTYLLNNYDKSGRTTIIQANSKQKANLKQKFEKMRENPRKFQDIFKNNTMIVQSKLITNYL